MNKSEIKEVVLSLKNAIRHIPSEYDNTDRLLELCFESFKTAVETLFPFKFFAAKVNEFDEYQLAIFDDEQTRDTWIKNNFNDFDCFKISESRFYELSQDEWYTPSCYTEKDGILVFDLL